MPRSDKRNKVTPETGVFVGGQPYVSHSARTQGMLKQGQALTSDLQTARQNLAFARQNLAFALPEQAGVMPGAAPSNAPMDPYATVTYQNQQFRGAPQDVLSQIQAAKRITAPTQTPASAQPIQAAPVRPPATQPLVEPLTRPQRQRAFRKALISSKVGAAGVQPIQAADEFMNTPGVDRQFENIMPMKNEPGYSQNRGLIAEYREKVKDYEKNLAELWAGHRGKFSNMDEYTEFLQSVPGYDPVIKEAVKRIAITRMPKNLQEEKEKADKIQETLNWIDESGFGEQVLDPDGSIVQPARFIPGPDGDPMPNPEFVQWQARQEQIEAQAGQLTPEQEIQERVRLEAFERQLRINAGLEAPGTAPLTPEQELQEKIRLEVVESNLRKQAGLDTGEAQTEEQQRQVRTQQATEFLSPYETGGGYALSGGEIIAQDPQGNPVFRDEKGADRYYDDEGGLKPGRKPFIPEGFESSTYKDEADNTQTFLHPEGTVMGMVNGAPVALSLGGKIPVGVVIDGKEYLGGNPRKKESWKTVGK